MRALLVTGMYPKPDDPVFGRFVDDQMRALALLEPSLSWDLLFFDGRASRLNYLRAIREVRRRVARAPYDLVHAHYGLAGLAAVCQSRAPVVLTLHGSDVAVPWQRALTRLAIARSAAVIAVSRRMKETLEGPGGGPEGEVEVIPCGIDLERFHPRPAAEARRRLGWPEGGKRVLFPGDPGRRVKGHGLFRAVIGSLRDAGLDLTEVTLAGVPPDRVPILMNACDLMLMTSRSEGSPMVVKEAMASNLPLVSLDVGDVAEVAAGASQCEVVNARADSPKAREALAGAARRILEGGERSGGRARVAHLSHEAIARRVLAIYRRAAASRDGPLMCGRDAAIFGRAGGTLPVPLGDDSCAGGPGRAEPGRGERGRSDIVIQ
ncbi:MAG TPA: glycosyltransferase [Candidatus Polarisedimenticolia bacterium]